VAKITLRDKEHLATMRIREGVFVLETMYWPDEIRRPEFEVLAKSVEIRSQELAMAGSLIELLGDHFDPSQFVDTYRARLEEARPEQSVGGEREAPISCSRSAPGC
jgi:DNA end-binding protein Ku